LNFEKSSSTNWIFSLQKLISKLIFASYTGSKNQVQNRQKIQFVELDFSKLIFQKSSTVQQGVKVLGIEYWKSPGKMELYDCKQGPLSHCDLVMLLFVGASSFFAQRPTEIFA
jgi:hypothetical protein